jgi:predicted nucleotidyltransferase
MLFPIPCLVIAYFLSSYQEKRLNNYKNTDILTEKTDNIKKSVLKFVPAKYIYLFGFYAYGNPTEESDIDIYVVTPDNINNFSELYAKIIGDLEDKKYSS